MTEVNGTLYFSAYSAGAGRELWQSDGTAAGTTLVADIVPGDMGIYPSSLETVGGILLFTGDDGLGRELWVYDPEGEAPDESIQLTIFVDSQAVSLPANVGVQSDDSTAATYTLGSTGEIHFDADVAPTLGAFFDTWRLDAGLAGNNADAVLSATQLLDNVADTTSTVQMFVNGQVSHEFDTYVLQDGDEIALVYGANPVVSLNTNFGPIIIELFEPATPGTVDNFLNYVNDGDYINSFFHRSDPGFVIQGGGFITSSTTFSSTAQFSSVPTDPPILNEPGISNLRGTVAMAKTSNPDSATSQFFVNLSDTNTFLDSVANGAFTVFGQVLGMATVDRIEDVPLNTSNASPFGELPVSASGELVVIQDIGGQGNVTGIKFSDDNANGVRDGAEAGIAGATVYVDADDDGLFDAGEVATVTDADGRFLIQLEPGTYVVRTEPASGWVATLPVGGEGYDVTVEFGREVADIDFGETPLAAPTAVDLLPGSDTGAASDDDVTNLNNASIGQVLQFQVSGVVSGAEVFLLSDGQQVFGSAVASGDVVTITTDGTATLSDGARSITAVQVHNGVQSSQSDALVVNVDTAPPAAIATTAPNIAEILVLYSFDADSPDESSPGITYQLVNAPTGMTVDAATGEIAWTPTADQAVPTQFEIQVADSAGNVTSQTVDLTVLGAIPALPDDYSVDEDDVLVVDAATGVLANDGNQTSGTLSATIAQPSHGAINFSADGSFTYTPSADFFGEDSFNYQASDGVNDTNVAQVTIVIVGVNDPPTAVADAYSTVEDTALTVDAATGLLLNDSDADGDAITATLVSQPDHGLVVLNADGSFSYTPDAEFSGTDSFTYALSDGQVCVGQRDGHGYGERGG